MAETITRDDGTEVVLHTAEELEAAKTEGAASVKTELEQVQTQLAEANRINAERGDNFTAYSKMTEEQKKAFDANTTVLLKREEQLLSEVELLKTNLSEKETRERDGVKNNAMLSLHAGDEATKTKLEDAYKNLAGMPESTQEEINKRVSAAARVAGIVIDNRNPLYMTPNGEAPKSGANKEYVDTNEGSQAAAMVREAMGMPDPNTKK